MPKGKSELWTRLRYRCPRPGYILQRLYGVCRVLFTTYMICACKHRLDTVEKTAVLGTVVTSTDHQAVHSAIASAKASPLYIRHNFQCSDIRVIYAVLRPCWRPNKRRGQLPPRYNCDYSSPDDSVDGDGERGGQAG